MEKAATALLITVLLILWAGCYLRWAEAKIKEIQASREEGIDGPVQDAQRRGVRH